MAHTLNSHLQVFYPVRSNVWMSTWVSVRSLLACQIQRVDEDLGLGEDGKQRPTGPRQCHTPDINGRLPAKVEGLQLLPSVRSPQAHLCTRQAGHGSVTRAKSITEREYPRGI